MDIVLTGTGSPLPDANRAGPSTLIKAGAKRLVLTHMVPAPTAEQYSEWIALAAEHYEGEIIIGDDLTTIATGQE